MKNIRLIYVLSVLVLATLIFTGASCSQNAGGTQKTQTGASVSAEVGKNAPNFLLSDLNGNTVELKNIDKPVVLAFVSTHCGACIQQMPALNSFAQAHQDIQVMAIFAGEDKDIVKKFKEDHNLTFTLLLDPSAQVVDWYNIQATPTFFSIDKDGKIIAHFEGMRDQATLEKDLKI